MSTRCTVTVKDEMGEYTIYRHCDGYPDHCGGVLATLPLAFKYAWKLPRFEASDFAAAIIRAWKGDIGGNIRCSTGHDAHGDTEFQYTIWQDDDHSLVVNYVDDDGPRRHILWQLTPS